MHASRIILFSVLGLLIAGPVLAAGGGQQCAALFEVVKSEPVQPAKFDERLELLRRGEYAVQADGLTYQAQGVMTFRAAGPNEHRSGVLIGEMRFFVDIDGVSNEQIGSAEFAYDTVTKVLEIRRTVLDAGFEKNGLTTLAVGAALEHFPDAELITGRLVQDNAARFDEIYKRSMASNPDEKMLDAFRATPFFKTARAHGFTEVDIKASYYHPEKNHAIDRIFIQLRRQ